MATVPEPSGRPAPLDATGLALWLLALCLFTLAIQYLFAVRPAGLYWWTWALGALQLGIAEALRVRCGPRPQAIWSAQGWQYALIVLAGVQVLQWAGVQHGPPRMPASLLLIELVHFMVLVAYLEELWFRGVWFALWGGRLWPAVIAGSLLFGLYHLPQGLTTVLTTTCVGLLFAAARWRGASLLMLALAHGTMNWLNNAAWPAQALRMEATLFVALFCSGCVLLAVGLLVAPRARQSLE